MCAAFLCACYRRANEYTLAQVHVCFDALDSVVEERKATVDERTSREIQLLARGAWNSIHKAITTDKASTLGRRCSSLWGSKAVGVIHPWMAQIQTVCMLLEFIFEDSWSTGTLLAPQATSREKSPGKCGRMLHASEKVYC